MAFRIGEQIVGGYLNNKQRNRVSGWLAFDDRRGVHLQLIGDLGGDLAGRRIEFEAANRTPASDDVIESLHNKLSLPQIGAAGDMLLRIARVPDGPEEELMARARLGELPPIHEQPCLCLEWFSQNGRVVAEIVGVVVRDVVEDGEPEKDIEPAPLPDEDSTHLGVAGLAIDEFGNARELEFDGEDPEDDPYGLFPENLDAELSESAGNPADDLAFPEDQEPRNWDEIIPGIDPETKAMYEAWDEIYGGKNHEPISSLLDPPLQLPPPDDVVDEATARSYVLQIAASLARVSVAFDLCKHFTMVRAYRWLVEEILTEGAVHPDQLAHDIVTHYSSCEFCQHCEAEFDAEYEREQEGN